MSGSDAPARNSVAVTEDVTDAPVGLAEPASSETATEASSEPTEPSAEEPAEPASEVTEESSAEPSSDREALSWTMSGSLEVGSAGDSSFEIHFIDVGQGDAALIICDGEVMMIDGGSGDKSDLIFSYLKKLNIDHVKYMVATHEDADHTGGLAGALHKVTVDDLLGEARSLVDLEKFANGAAVSRPLAGTQLPLGSATAVVLGPVDYSLESDNNSSIVIKVTYGETSFLFTGDAEFTEETSIMGSGADLQADVLKVSHHGSAGATSAEFLAAVVPAYAVISCSRENPYRHPATETLDRLKAAGVTLFRTELCGDIICRSDGESITFETEKESQFDPYVTYDELNPAEEVASSEPQSGDGEDENLRDYILNSNSGIIHIPSCPHVKKMSSNNKVVIKATSLEDAIEKAKEMYSRLGNIRGCKNGKNEYSDRKN